MVRLFIFYIFLFVELVVSLNVMAQQHPQPVPDCDGIHCDLKCGCEEGMSCNKKGLCESDHGCSERLDTPGCIDCACEDFVCDLMPECCTDYWGPDCVHWCMVYAWEHNATTCLPCDKQPDCKERECGLDPVCHKSCGRCPEGKVCNARGKCVDCIPDCHGKVCGPDGCGGSCGTCPEGTWCDFYGQCTFCRPRYLHNQCGLDGCGSRVGTCHEDEVCREQYSLDTGKSVAGICEKKQALCKSKSDCPYIKDPDLGCCIGNKAMGRRVEMATSDKYMVEFFPCVDNDGSLQKCVWDGKEYGCKPMDFQGPTDPHPQLRECDWPCKPDCKDRECGPDGCGGICGECPNGYRCEAGKCKKLCQADCKGKQCGPDGCGGSCGTCPEGAVCVGNFCQWDCAFIPEVGCCQGNNLVTCENGKPHLTSCKTLHEADVIRSIATVCGWDKYRNKYTCFAYLRSQNGVGFAPSNNVTGQPLWCHSECVPHCGKKECGPDGCGGSCGSCADGLTCVKGKCMESLPEPEPDTAEDVQSSEETGDDTDVINKTDHRMDSEKVSVDLYQDLSGKEGIADVNKDTPRDKKTVDEKAPEVPRVSSGGSCSTGVGSLYDIWLILLGLLILMLRRRSLQRHS